MSVLEIAEPESYILIIVLEVIGTLAVLLVLQPLSFVSLAIRESIYAISAALSLDVGTLVSITILIYGRSLALWLAAYHLSLILTAITGDAATEGDFLRRHGKRRTCQHHRQHHLLTCKQKRAYRKISYRIVFLIIHVVYHHFDFERNRYYSHSRTT